jgi:hypothetical protein
MGVSALFVAFVFSAEIDSLLTDPQRLACSHFPDLSPRADCEDPLRESFDDGLSYRPVTCGDIKAVLLGVSSLSQFPPRLLLVVANGLASRFRGVTDLDDALLLGGLLRPRLLGGPSLVDLLGGDSVSSQRCGGMTCTQM